MTTEARASVQYGDMRGTIAVDGHNGVAAINLLSNAGKLSLGPGNHWPVGIEIYHEPAHGSREPTIYLLFMDVGDQDGGGADAVRAYAKDNAELPVKRVRTELAIGDIMPLVKRLSIVLQDRSTEGRPLMVSDQE